MEERDFLLNPWSLCTPHTLECTNLSKHPTSSICHSCVAAPCWAHRDRWELWEKRGKEWKMGEDSTSVLQFYDFVNVLERLEVEPNCSPSCVYESEVLTGPSLANKAARHSHSRGMRVLSDAVKEEESGKRFSFSLKLRKSLLPGRRAVLLGSYLGVTKEPSLPNAWQKTKR